MNGIELRNIIHNVITDALGIGPDSDDLCEMIATALEDEGMLE